MLHALSLVFFSALLIGGVFAIASMLRDNRHLIERALGVQSEYRIAPLPYRAPRNRHSPVITRQVAPRAIRAAA